MWFPILLLIVSTALGAYMYFSGKKAERWQEDEHWDFCGDMETYDFELPPEVEEYNALKEKNSTENLELARCLLRRAMADIPLIEKLEKDHPNMARMFKRNYVPKPVWEDLRMAENELEAEIHEVQQEAEGLKESWGQGIFPQAMQMLRQQRAAQAQQAGAAQEECALLMLNFETKGKVVKLTGKGERISKQTKFLLTEACQNITVPLKSTVTCRLDVGERKESYHCHCDDLTIEEEKEKQWKQIGTDAKMMRIQARFVKRDNGGFCIDDIRVTIPMPEEGSS